MPALGGAHLDPAYRRGLLTCAALNLAMLLVEGGIGLRIGSAALLADAVDFLEDSGLYLLAVAALGWSQAGRARAGGAMGLAMMAVGLAALWQVVARLVWGGIPEPAPLGATAALALAVNVYCASRLAPWKRGDASMRSIWLSTRNDAVLNGLTILAAGGVALTASAWPDLLAGGVIAAVNLWAAAAILAQARAELRTAASA